MQSNAPLTPALSPSDGAREKNSTVADRSLDGDSTKDGRRFSLSLSERERAGVRVFLDCIDTAKELIPPTSSLGHWGKQLEVPKPVS